MKKNEKEDESENKIKYSFRAFLLGFELPMMQQLTGINAIVTQSSNIVGDVIPSLASYTPLITNAVQLVATAACVLLLTRVGRKPLTLFGNLGLGICDIIIGILFLLPDWAPSGMLIFVFLIIYMIIYGISLGPVVWLYVPEIIPAKIVPLATMMNWLGCSFSVILTPIVIDQTKTTYPVFFFFGGITIIFFIINSVLMV